MQIDFEELMANKSDEGLVEYLANTNIYTIEAIKAAVNELKKRGRKFTEEEIVDLNAKINEKLNIEKKEAEILPINSWKKNIVDDPEAPVLYSQRAIWFFSTIFTVIFGAVLLASNLTDKKAKRIVIGFGIIYTTIGIIILNQLPQNSVQAFVLNAIGAIVLTQLFWNKYIGDETKFKAKAILKPLIISILIMIPFILAVIYGGVE